MREIGIGTIYTNGWPVDEALLDGLVERNLHPSFHLSFDGVGWHDYLHGIPGAEERTIAAIKLLRGRGHHVSVAICMHRKSRPVLRGETLLTHVTRMGMLTHKVLLDLNHDLSRIIHFW